MRGHTLRIALFSEVYWPMVSGVSVTLRRLVDAMQARGHELRVYSASYPLPDGTADRAEVHRSPGRTFFLAPEIQWAQPRQDEVLADLRAFRPDVVHLATEFAMGRSGLRGARTLGVPIIASAHTDYERYAARYGMAWAVRPGWHYLRHFYRHAHRVLCPTRIYEQHLRRRGVHHTGLWTRGVNGGDFHPRHRSNAFRARFGAGPDDLLVTNVGRIAPEKGIDVLLDAWARLGERRGRAQLVLVGQGLMEETVRRRRLPGVHLIGMQHGAELSAAYASADIFAFPSTTETFGNVLLEAMSSGLPSVVAAAGGVLEFAIDGRNSLHTRPGSVESFAAGLERLLGDAELRHRLAAGGRATALGRRWDAIYDGLTDDYRAAIDAEAQASAA
jgi:glycosyltransferase involved in cell wall biosynthesis